MPCPDRSRVGRGSPRPVCTAWPVVNSLLGPAAGFAGLHLRPGACARRGLRRTGAHRARLRPARGEFITMTLRLVTGFHSTLHGKAGLPLAVRPSTTAESAVCRPAVLACTGSIASTVMRSPVRSTRQAHLAPPGGPGTATAINPDPCASLRTCVEIRSASGV